MNIINTMCKLSELSQWEIDSIVDAMPRSPYFDFDRDEKFIGFTECDAGTWEPQDEFEIVTYTEMMQLLGKTMQFTKSDLKAGVHFVNDRDGVLYAVCRNTFCGLNGFVGLSSFNDELVNVKGNSELDIIEVYETDGDRSMTSYLKGKGLTKIWERTEQTEAQKEMEVLQAKMDELQEQMKVVQAKL
jgi:hypothetical protein